MTPYVTDPDFTLYVGDVLDVLAELPDESVHCCVTSPPYWGLRDYGTSSWDGGDPECDHIRPSTTLNAGFNERWGQGAGERKQEKKSDDQYPRVCAKCEAVRIDQQLGLEATPEEYVARMVDVFRQVRRVLRRDGTCWLNIGDSYASGGLGGASGQSTLEGGGGRYRAGSKLLAMHEAGMGKSRRVAGAKSKDLVGIPWRLAFALQQPYYTGTIKDERDRIWLAAMIDAEGCIYIHKRKIGQANGQGYERKNDSYGSGLEISNTSREIVERALAIVGKGSIATSTRGRNQPLYRWNLRTNACRDVLREVYPHLVAKQHQARLAIGCPSSGKDAEAAHASLIALHAGDAPTIDFPAPPSLFEPGWYVRSDVIWSKLNPMPESVTDRPTKAHEYLFLLTRSPRYFYDADAIRERYQDGPGLTGGAYAPPGQAPHGNARGPDGRHVTRVVGADGSIQHRDGERWPNGGRNKRSVWEIATESYPDAHFATFPQALVEPCVKAGCPEQVCATCGTPRERVTSIAYENPGNRTSNGARKPEDHRASGVRTMASGKRLEKRVTTDGFTDCGHDTYTPGVVLDPFMGSGTTALVARRLGRNSIGIELNPVYAELAAQRLSQLSLLAGGAA